MDKASRSKGSRDKRTNNTDSLPTFSILGVNLLARPKFPAFSQGKAPFSRIPINRQWTKDIYC